MFSGMKFIALFFLSFSCLFIGHVPALSMISWQFGEKGQYEIVKKDGLLAFNQRNRRPKLVARGMDSSLKNVDFTGAEIVFYDLKEQEKIQLYSLDLLSSKAFYTPKQINIFFYALYFGIFIFGLFCTFILPFLLYRKTKRPLSSLEKSRLPK